MSISDNCPDALITNKDKFQNAKIANSDHYQNTAMADSENFQNTMVTNTDYFQHIMTAIPEQLPNKIFQEQYFRSIQKRTTRAEATSYI